MSIVNTPRILIGATGSGCGKTTVVCGILQALLNRGVSPVSFKCGPDYIDPMFHSEVIGVKSRNLDLFFNSKEIIQYLLQKNSSGKDLAVIEGVMGYYDGLGAVTAEASSWDLAVRTKTPAVLLVDTKGKSYSVLAEIKGFLSLKENSQIKGVILNRISPMLYPGLKKEIEAALPVKVLGYVPVMTECSLESRHLGLVTAKEVKNLKEILNRLAGQFEESINLDALLSLARSAEPLPKRPSPLPAGIQQAGQPDFVRQYGLENGACRKETAAIETAGEKPQAVAVETSVKIAIASDKAFCFYYQDNLDLLQELGAELVFFSPLANEPVPEDVGGMILGGGYPELYLPQLTANKTTLESVRRAVDGGMPTIAECGGFMFLHEFIQDQDGNEHAMAGALPGSSFPVNRLVRFGYIGLTALADNLLCKKGEILRGHEFHHWDSTEPGQSYLAEKPVGARNWQCIRSSQSLFAGYPHIHFYSNVQAAFRFLTACRSYQEQAFQSKDQAR